MGRYLDGNGLTHFMGILKGYFVPQSRTVNGHALTSNVTVTAADIGVASGAEVNQNAFSNVKVGSTTVAADAKTDTLELVAGMNISLTPDATNDSVTVATSFGNPLNGAFVGATASTDGEKGLVPDLLAGGQDKLLFGNGTWDPINIIEFYDQSDGQTGLALTRTVGGGSDRIISELKTTSLLSADEKTKLDSLTIDGVSVASSGAAIHFGTCSTAAATAAKTVSCAGFTLVTGAWVAVKFTVTNTAAVANLTLSVNSTTAKPIKYRGANLSSAGVLAASRVYLFVYDGTNFELIGDLDTNTDTKNTAGSTDSSSKLFLVGATSQAANPQTYSQDTAYVGTDGHLYSNSVQVVNLSGTQALTNKTYNGYTLAAACAKGVDTSIAANSTSTNLPTTAAVVNYIGQVAGALVYKGAVNAESALLNTALKTGWFYIVGTAGSYGGKVCEVGDMIIVNTAGTYTSSSALGAKIDVIQTNIETLSNAEIDTLWTNAAAA